MSVVRAIILLTLLFSRAALATQTSLDITVGDTDIPVQRYTGAHPEAVLLWLPGEQPYGEARAPLTARLAEAGFDVWYADLFAARFLPPGVSSLNALEPGLVSALIEHVFQTTHKPVLLFSNDHGAGLALRAAAHYRANAPAPDHVLGALLISPNLLTQTPKAGQDPAYLPVIDERNLPVFMIMPKHSVGYLRSTAMQTRLAAAGTVAYTQAIDQARDRFFFRPDATAKEAEATRELPGMLRRAAALLQQTPASVGTETRPATVTASSPASDTRTLGQQLLPYQGSIAHAGFTLADLHGNQVRLADYQGKVVLVNFWASWCPPCVHEIPSMQQLKQRLAGQPFSILAINMGESPGAVRAFMQRMRANFTVLLDTDNRTTLAWKVQAFPTSFLVDKTGAIRYGVFGAVDWQAAAVARLITTLMAEDVRANK